MGSGVQAHLTPDHRCPKPNMLVKKFLPPMLDGVGASCTVLPADGTWTYLLEFLLERFPHIDEAAWRQRFKSGQVLAVDGSPLNVQSAFVRGMRVWYYRTVEHEAHIPFEAKILWQDERLLVVDKPHFLPVVPSGKYVRETLLARLRRDFNNPFISPVHRIDRDTAGVVLFTLDEESRSAYQNLFRTRKVHKTYECIAAWNDQLDWPVNTARIRSSRIEVSSHFMQQKEVHGEVNAITTITLLEALGALARYRLEPLTGQRHQLRVHMAAQGLPIHNDGIYPTLMPEWTSNYSRPLQLLAKSIAFIDPFSEESRKFTSRQALMNLDQFQNITK